MALTSSSAHIPFSSRKPYTLQRRKRCDGVLKKSSVQNARRLRVQLPTPYCTPLRSAYMRLLGWRAFRTQKERTDLYYIDNHYYPLQMQWFHCHPLNLWPCWKKRKKNAHHAIVPKARNSNNLRQGCQAAVWGEGLRIVQRAEGTPLVITQEISLILYHPVLFQKDLYSSAKDAVW